MGIRFECPHCQYRLNVKSFLAGKHGVCPQCRGAVQIPLGSGDTPGSDTPGGEIPRSEAPRSETPRSEAPRGETPRSDLPRSDTPRSSGDRLRPGATAVAEPKTAPRVPAGPKPPASPAREPSPKRRPGDSLAGPAAEASSSAGASSPRPAGPRPGGSDRAAPRAASGTGGGPASAPWEAEPDAIWYVRPPSGGQFGPAQGAVMSRWVAEGRVAPEAFVWREGWESWRLASEVLSLSSAGAPAEVPPAATASPTPSPGTRVDPAALPDADSGTFSPASPGAAITAEQRYLRRRRGRQGLWTTAVVLLAITAGLLLAALAYVLQRGT